MVRPLYPLRPKKKIEKKQPSLWKNPYIIGISSICVLFFALFGYHLISYNSSVITDNSPSGEDKGLFSFLKPSKFLKNSSENKDSIDKQRLIKMGIASNSKVLTKQIKIKDLREQRRIMAMRKYEASRETAIKFKRKRDEQRKRLNTPTARELKSAITALEASDNLGIMKLERLLDNHLRRSGGDSKDIDVLIFAYDSLAKVYEKKNMKDKAKESYVSAFKLMKRKAPIEQEAGWDEAIGQVENMKTTTTTKLGN